MRMKHIMTVTLLLLSIGIIYTNTLSLEDNGDGTWNVNFTSDDDIGGFQFNIDDVTVNSASGGEAEANGFFHIQQLDYSFRFFFIWDNDSCWKWNAGSSKRNRYSQWIEWNCYVRCSWKST